MENFTGCWLSEGGWTEPLPEWDGPSTLVLVFGCSAMLDEPGPIRELAARYPQSVLVGCSTSGEIYGPELLDGSLTVAVTRFAQTRVQVEVAEVNEAAESGDAGRTLSKRLRESGDDLVAILVFSDGLGVNGSALAAGLADGAGDEPVVTGGLAGDADRFERTWVVVDGEPRPGYVTAVGLFGHGLEVGYASRGGWTILGPQRTVTRSVGNVLYELDGLPALDLYKTYLGDRVSGLPATAMLFPLAIRLPGAPDNELVRTVLAVDEEQQSMTFAGDVPEGSTAQLMRGTTDRLVESAQAAAAAARVERAGPSLAIAVSCVGRRLYLGQRSEEELEAVELGLPEGASLVGFYSYGELSPTTSGACALHNQTMTLTVLQERQS